MVYRITLIAVAVLLIACSDPKAASEKNFKISIQKSLDAAYPMCYVKANFPAAIPASDPYRSKSELQALVSAGLLSVKEESREVSEKIFFSDKIRIKMVVEMVYNLTEEGKKFYKADGEKDLYGKPIGGFCFGKATVKEIPEFTEPADAGGVRSSRVTYTYQVSELPDWAKLPATIAVIPRLKKDVESEKTPIKSMAMLMLTNNGWTFQFGGF